MKNIYKHIILWMFFLFYSLNTAGLKAKEITVISDSEDFYQMGLKTEFIADKGGTLNFEAAINAKDYKKSEKVVPNFGFTKDVYWFKSSFLVSESSQKPWYLVIGYPLLDYVNIYFILPDGTKIIKKVGDRLPFSHREYKNRKFLFSLSQFPKGQEIKVYFKVKTSSSMQFPISIAYEKTFVEKDRDETLMAGLINGSLFIMMFYNLFIFLTTKDRSYINLVIFILGSIGFETGITGWSFQYLWPNLVLWGNINVPFFGSIVNYGALSVAINLTNSENDSPKLTKILKVGYKIALFNAVLSLLIPYKFAIQIIVIYGLPSILLCFTAGFIGLKNKYKPAKIYLFSWSAFLLGTAIIILSKLGFLPSNFVTENGMFIGMVLQALLLSFALAQTINILQSEKDQAQKESTMRLEEQVTILKEINNTTANLCSNHELLEMLKSAAQDLVEILSLKRASIYLISDKFPEELNYMVHSGADPLKTFKTKIPKKFGLFGKAFETAKSYISYHNTEDPSFVPFNSQISEGTKHLMIVPLFDEKKPLGAFCLVDKKDGNPFEDRHQNIAETIATSVQVSLQNINLLRETGEKIRMEKELETAKIVQAAFIPKEDPSFSGFSLSSYFKSASECGGDYWEYLDLEDKFILLIGDVTGHGTPSALITAISASYQNTLRVIHREIKDQLDLSPCKILERLNEIIYSSARSAFWMTFHCAVIEKETLRMTYAHAGHTFPMLLREDQNGKPKVKSITGLGSPLGVTSKWKGIEQKLQLNPGDLFVWFTDGLIECTNPKGEQIGKRYIRRLLEKQNDKKTPELCNEIITNAFEFFDGTPIDDDITLLVGKISADYKINTAAKSGS